MIRLIAPGLLALLLGACASRPDCRPDLAARRAFENGLSGGELADAYPECETRLAELRSAYAAVVRAACPSSLAWAAGASGKAIPPACRVADGPDWRSALDLGRQHARLSERLREIEARQAAGGVADGALRVERVAVVRDLEQLEGVAALRGWIEAPLPAR